MRTPRCSRGCSIDNPLRYDAFLDSDRLTLAGGFARAGWRTVAVMPGTSRDWPEGAVYRYAQVYDGRSMGYRGPPFPLGVSLRTSTRSRLFSGSNGRAVPAERTDHP